MARRQVQRGVINDDAEQENLLLSTPQILSKSA